MRHLKKIWVRVLVSLIGGGMANEIFFLSTGEATRSRENEGNGITMVATIAIFIILTIVVDCFKLISVITSNNIIHTGLLKLIWIPK